MVELTQIKDYMCKIQLAEEENQYLRSKSDAADSRAQSLNVFSMADTVLAVSQMPHLLRSAQDL